MKYNTSDGDRTTWFVTLRHDNVIGKILSAFKIDERAATSYSNVKWICF